jgi:hypothetical protein
MFFRIVFITMCYDPVYMSCRSYTGWRSYNFGKKCSRSYNFDALTLTLQRIGSKIRTPTPYLKFISMIWDHYYLLPIRNFLLVDLKPLLILMNPIVILFFAELLNILFSNTFSLFFPFDSWHSWCSYSRCRYNYSYYSKWFWFNSKWYFIWYYPLLFIYLNFYLSPTSVFQSFIYSYYQCIILTWYYYALIHVTCPFDQHISVLLVIT